MKKSSILLGALLVTASVAYAAEPGTTPQPNGAVSAQPKRGINDVKESFKDMGRRARDVTHDLTHRGDRRHAVRASDNRGYGGDTSADMSGDAQRRQRMDAAYANWQSKR
ncbi:MAG TPA: hypothetical protein VK968_01415 [Roseimicrobium sp.]|nr:hypothetical protein [Roseimicrobium sp.]